MGYKNTEKIYYFCKKKKKKGKLWKIQFVFSIFIVTKISTDIAIVYILAIAGWMASNLKFKFVDWKIFYKACLAEVGYFLVSGFVFLMFGLI